MSEYTSDGKPDPLLDDVIVWSSEIRDALGMIEAGLLTKGDRNVNYFWITLQQMADYSRSLSEAIKKCLSQ